MGSNLIKPYEISLWEDVLITEEDSTSYYKEIKIATIGSNEMTALSRARDPILTTDITGEVTFTFEMVHRYYDYDKGAYEINPFEQYLVNERKIKLYYDDIWYDFILKDCVEQSEENIFSYTAKSLFINELSKVGYNISLTKDLNNNQGTLLELAEKVVEGTDWTIDSENSDIIQQFVAEPLYMYRAGGAITVLDIDNKTDITISSNEIIYVFYSAIANSQEKNVQFLREVDSANFITDDNNVKTGPNYRFKSAVTYNDNSFSVSNVNFTLITSEDNTTGINLNFQGYRLAYNQRSVYDEVKDRLVSVYQTNRSNNEDEQIIYKYTDYEYVTSNLVSSFITNGSNFNIYSDGSMVGWSNATPVSKNGDNRYILQPLKLITYPSIDTSAIIPLNEIPQIKGYLQTKFSGISNASNNYSNTIFNSGIGDYRSTINSFSKGEEYVFRISYCYSNSENGLFRKPNNSEIRAIIAKYTIEQLETYNTETEETETKNVYSIDPKNILFNFNGSFEVSNNVISGGTFGTDSDGNYVTYYKDGVLITPSEDYYYEEGNLKKIWDFENQKFIDLDSDESNFLNYYHTTARCQQTISNADLSDNGKKIGIFLYTDSNNLINKYVNIKEVQLFKKKVDGNGNIVLIGNIPSATSIETDFYYLKPDKGMAGSEIETYSSLSSIADSLSLDEEDIVPIYNEECEKISSIEASKSNCFNIIQDLCEAFECWAKFDIEHDAKGAIALDEDGAPSKTISFHKYTGDENFAGFKYGINLNSIQRTFNSDEIVTKLIVEEVPNDTVDGGIISIASAKSNPSGESYILNMSYYLNQGLIEDKKAFYSDYTNFLNRLKRVNNDYNALKTRWQLAELSRIKSNSNVNIYTELIEKAQIDLTERIEEFKQLTGISYDNYVQKNGFTLSFERGASRIISAYNKKLSSIVPSFYDENGEEILCISSESYDISDEISQKEYVISNININNYTISDIKYIAIVNELPGYDIIDSNVSNYLDYTDIFNDTPDLINQRAKYIWNFDNVTKITIKISLSNDNETLVSLIGHIYTDSQTIKDYSPLLVNVKQEKSDLDLLIDGTSEFSLSVTTTSRETSEPTKELMSLYKTGLNFSLYSSSDATTPVEEIESSETEKSFSQESLCSKITFTSYPEGYQIKYKSDNEYITTTSLITCPLSVDSTKVFTFVPIEDKKGLTDLMDDSLEEKKEIESDFYKKYSRFIQEGTWTSQDYVDSELYYLDSLKISNTSAQPKVEYELAVYEVSELEDFENYNFKVGDKTYIQDPQFFGYDVKEEVIVSEVVWHLDNPVENTIKIQNYKTQFEDLFSRVAAAVQSVEYNKAIYARTTSILNENGFISPTLLSESLSNLSQGYSLSANGTVLATEDGIITLNPYEPVNRLRVGASGIKISNDNGDTWQTILTADGITTNALTSGTIDTQQINIIDGSNASFRWDKAGLSAYGFDDYENDGYDLKTYVRFDKYGIYGIENGENFVASSLDEIKDIAHFGLTWDGFFIKNSYTDGYVSLSSDNDFQVIQNINGTDQEKIKIGALEFDSNGNPTKYGINIKDDAGNVVFTTGDDGDLIITGTINAAAGNIGGMVVNDDSLTMDTIVLEPGVGIYSTETTDDNEELFIISDVDGSAVFNNITAKGTIYAEAGEIGGMTVDETTLAMNHTVFESGVGIYSDIDTEDGEPKFIISDITGSAIFEDITARGHIDATSGSLSNLSVKNTITVGESEDTGIIKSINYVTGQSGWTINSSGFAEFDDITARGHIDATSGSLSNLTVKNYITVGENGNAGSIRSINYSAGNTGWAINSDGSSEFSNITARGHIEASTGTLGNLNVIDTITVQAGGQIQSSNYSEENNTGWLIDDTGATLNNASVRGKITALEGDFLGAVNVGDNSNPSNDYIIIDGQNAVIRSSNYQDGAGYGWKINSDGDAVFNNITARGAIKTAVFEYAEIQAVGGIFIFRPSSTIRTAEISGDDLIVTVEKFALFRTGDWCKVSNYIADGTDPDANVQNILVTNGLTHVYEISLNNENGEITLINGKSFIEAVKKEGETNDEVSQRLAGGALVDMGNKGNGNGEVGTNNYGIGINSSDNTVNLPARAITLFESVIDETREPKVTYKYRGILGTLPTLSTSDVSDSIYNLNMAGTQGIYTDNMYIGDNDQFIAFYEDKSDLDENNNPKRKLKIKANQVVYEVVDDQGQTEWHDVSDIETEGVPGPQGPAGQDAIRVEIDPIGGNFIKRGQVGTSLIAHVYEGINDITNQFSHFTWYRRKPDGTIDTSWSTQETSNQLSITTADVDESAVFVCEVTVTR